MALSFPPDQAWQPLPAELWTPQTARHLLRRAGWSASADEIHRAVADGLQPTLERLFPREPTLLPMPAALEALAADAPKLQRQAREKTGEERRMFERDLRERGRAALQDLSIKWLIYAADPSTAAFAKWTLFLSDVYVVSAEKVRNPALMFEHFDILARHALGTAPLLSKAVSRSPAMVIYLDLNQSQRQAPNENFARELFELFVLGEGNYTERDIKESARAFTGYRAQPFGEGFHFARGQHDPSLKTIFGETGHFFGDDVIDLAYRQPAAGTFLPHELVKFYLSDTPLPREYLEPLGAAWRLAGYDLRWLARRFFGSRAFFAPEFQGNFIKSPMQFYLGLVQDLQLQVPPLPRLNVNPLRQMGQWLFYPPNVRGWVGGKNWINSATLIARRQLVESLFSPLNERAFNADEIADLAAVRANGRSQFTLGIDAAPFSAIAALPPHEAADVLIERYLGGPSPRELAATLAQFLSTTAAEPQRHLRTVRRAAATLLQSPEYQLT